jgi:excisionase family DNA binding protein
MKQDHPRQTQETAQEGQQDRPQDVLDKLTVAQAADRLGVTQDAVRKRIARGTIRHEKDYEGHIFVYLDTFEGESKTDQDNGQDVGSKTVSDASQDKYTRSLEDQVDFLRRELERKDTIIMSLTQRIPELEASPEPREGHVTASEAADKSTPPPEQQEPSQRRSWLYRFFFGPE